jgi:hypothetical protein
MQGSHDAPHRGRSGSAVSFCGGFINPIGRLGDFIMITPEGLDRWRIIPRLLMVTMLVMTYRVVEWFMDIPADQVSIPQSALVSVMTGALTGAFGLYLGSDKSKSD